MRSDDEIHRSADSAAATSVRTRVAFATGAALATLGAVIFAYGGLGAQPNARGLAIGGAAFVAGLLLLVTVRRRAETVSEPLVFLVVAAAIAAPFLSDVDQRTFFYVTQGPLRRSHLWFALGGWLVGRWLFVAPDRRAPWLLAAVQLGLTAAFFDSSRGEIPVRDDHTAYLYRFFLLRESFPRFVFYNPQWNAGYLATEMIATGAHGPFLLAGPFFLFASAEQLFPAAIPYFFVIVLPWIVFAALRTFGIGAAGAALGALIAIAPTAVVFIYELVYGLYPFMLACAFAVLATALFDRLFVVRSGGFGTAVLLCVAATFCLVWLMGVVILGPILLVALWLARRFTAREWRLASFVAGMLLVVNLPWVLELSQRTEVGRFVVEQESPIAAHASIGAAIQDLAENAARVFLELHPVLWALAPVGLWVWWRDRATTACLLLALVLWNAAAGIVGTELKADVALERFPIPFALFLVVPAAVALDRLLRGSATPWRHVTFAVVIGGILLGAANAGEFLGNRGRYHYRVLPPDLARTIAAVREKCPRGRRVLVPGFSLHWFGGGHIAPLPMLGQRSFVGNDYYHRTDHRDVVPDEYRKPARFAEYLELYDVGCVLSWSENWIRMLDDFAPLRLLHDEGWLKLYANPGEPRPFLRGSGRVTETIGSLVVETTDDDVVIRHRWVDGLVAEPRVPIEPFPIDEELSFIRLRPSGVTRTELRYR